MKRALIHKNRVCQVVEAGQEFEVHHDLTWVDCPDGVEPETHEWDGSGFAEIVVVAPVPVIPQSATMRQARLALLGAGLLAHVNAAIEAMPGIEGEAARIEWEFASEIRRDSPLVSGLSEALGLTSEQLDALFIEAAKL